LVPHRASPSWSPSRSLTRQWRIQALVTGHGSPQVQRLLGAWAETAGKVENADQVMGLADRARGPAPGLEQEARQERRALEDHRKARCAAAGGCLCPDERGADRAGSAGPAVSRYCQRCGIVAPATGQRHGAAVGRRQGCQWRCVSKGASPAGLAGSQPAPVPARGKAGRALGGPALKRRRVIRPLPAAGARAHVKSAGQTLRHGSGEPPRI
jgi:hypothetical protein